MLATLSCIATEHDWRLLAGAVFVCVIGVATCLRLYVQSRKRQGGARLMMLLGGGALGGMAIWTTHFFSMLAYDPGSAFDYQIGLTLGSLIIAMAGAATGLVLAATGRGRAVRAAGGAVIGAAVAAMHYSGMAAVRAPAVISWDLSLAGAGVILAMVLWAAALVAVAEGGWRRMILGGALGVMGVCALHFTGMAALSVTPDPSIVVEAGAGEALAGGVAVAASMIAVIAALIEALAFWSRSSMLNQLREAIEAMPDGLGFYDAQDRLVIWNARYEEINPEIAPVLRHGATFRDMLQSGIDQGHYGDAIGREEEFIADRMAARARLSCSLEQKTADGRWLRVQDRRTADGGVVTLVNEITDLKRDAEILAAARDSAEAANRAKSQFLANMSHEIRTPLNGVIGVAQALGGTELNHQQQEMLELIRSSGVTLQHLLSDILDLARVESGRLELTEEPFDLAKAIGEAAHLYAAQAEDKGLRFFVDTPADCEVWVRGDVVRLKQILTNLVSNAVKFTNTGFVSLSVSRGQGGFRFMVEDTGIGFDSAARARLFSRFEQADGAITRRFGGTGLGLAICRELAGLMNGELDCESEPDGGSTFILSAPLPVVDAPLTVAPLPCADDDEGADRRPLRVLLADDHPTNRKVVEMILSQMEVELTMVEDGAQAVAAYRDADFDVVLMDMQMPVMDGLTATREIRLHQTVVGGPRTPIVMLTANALPEHVEAARAAGADHHLSKPFSAQDLIGLMGDLTNPAVAERATQAA